MAFVTPDYPTIRDRILRNIASLDDDADVGSDSDNYVRASSVGAEMEGLYQYQAWLYRQIFATTCDIDELVKKAAERGMTRKQATVASGYIGATGEIGTNLTAGSSVRHANGTMLVTMFDTPIGADGTATVLVNTIDTGSADNGLTGNATLTSPPLGIDAAVVITTSLSGGTDLESPASLLDRYLTLIRRPPAGGNKYDFQRWAESIPGVSKAFVYPLRRGLGTVDVAIVSANGLPSADLIATVQAYIDSVRPVGFPGCLVFAPTVIQVNIDAHVQLDIGYTMGDVLADAETQLGALFDTLAPGDSFVRSRGEAVISGLAGVLDRAWQSPAANVTATVDASQVQWLRLGNVTLEPM